MEINLNSLIGHGMKATDGEIGKVEEFYFNDKTWIIRYLIVKTGNWLSNRKVLIAREALLKDTSEPGVFPVNLTMEQIRNSPDIDTDKPVSRQHEIKLYGHYRWEPYWGSGFYGGGSMGNITNTFPVIEEKVITETDTIDNSSDNDPHLSSTHAVSGYHIQATDGDIGHVKDFIIDNETWQIKYMVVDTHNWFGGKKVLIPVSDIKEVKWVNSKVILHITTDAVKSSKLLHEPEFSFPVNIFEL